MIQRAKVLCAACGRQWAWEESMQFEFFEDVGAAIERSCPECKARAIDEAGVGPQFAKPLSDEREGRIFKAWTGRRTALAWRY